MTSISSISDGATREKRFYRDSDRAVLGGVCAGIARYLGFNVCATRFLAVIALFMTGPLLIVAYIAAIFLVPSASGREYPYEIRSRGCGYSSRQDRRAARRDARAARRDARAARRDSNLDEAVEPFYDEPVVAEVSERAKVVREKCEDLDARLRELEKTVTSKKFQIDEELRRL